MSGKKHNNNREKLIIPFKDGIPYTQPSGPNCRFKTLLSKGASGSLGIGLVVMKGPAWNEPGKHKDWQQVYVMLRGKGRMSIAKKKYQVKAPCVIRIPYNTEHAMRVGKGNYVEYLYINEYLDRAKRRKCKLSP